MPGSVWQFAAVGLGGMLGAMARYAIQRMGLPVHDTYVYTLIVNLAGSLAMGVVAALLSRYTAPGWLPLLLMTGFLGGFTTYSAFALDVVGLFDTGHVAMAVTYWLTTCAGAPALCAGAYLLLR